MSKNKKDCSFWESQYMNNRAFFLYYNRLLELAVSEFEWKNLPQKNGKIPGVDERFLELTLFANGQCLFFEDEVMGYLALQCTIGGNLNVYRVPTTRNAFASNGYYKELNEENSVIIYNNYMRTPSMQDIEYFAKRLCTMDRTIDVNINAQKTPILIACEETEKLTMAKLYEQYDGNKPYIFGRKNLQSQPLSAIKTDAPFVADKIYKMKEALWNECLTYLGIPNANTGKRERLITDEVLSSNGGTYASRNSRLAIRQRACEEINNMFGLDVSVDFRCGYDELVEETTNSVLGGGTDV